MNQKPNADLGSVFKVIGKSKMTSTSGLRSNVRAPTTQTYQENNLYRWVKSLLDCFNQQTKKKKDNVKVRKYEENDSEKTEGHCFGVSY